MRAFGQEPTYKKIPYSSHRGVRGEYMAMRRESSMNYKASNLLADSMHDGGCLIENKSSVSMSPKLIANRFLTLFYLCLLSAISPAFASRPTWVGVEIRSFAQIKAHPEVIYATGGGGLFKSLDRGQSWEPQKIPKESGDPKVLVVPEDHEHLIMWSQYLAKPEGKPFPLRYQESKDGGRTWAWKKIPVDAKKVAQNDQVSDLTIDLIERGGAWWVVIGNLLLRSADAGATWEINAENVQNRILLLHTPASTYRLSGNTLFRSNDRGAFWDVLHVFPVPENTKGFYATDLLSLSDGRLLLRINGVWYSAEDNGENLIVEEGGMADLPDSPRIKTTSVPNRFSDRSNWYCRVRQAEEAQDSLFAFCGWDNGSWPSALCLHRSQDGGKTWNKNSESLLKCHQDLPSWTPVSIWMDRADPNLIIASWMAGGVYRSEDGGKSWKNSDQGLRFRKPDNDSGFVAVHETKLIRAVIERDKPALEALLAEGANINASGNYVSGVLEADLSVLIRARSPQTQDILYRYLRSKGATPPSRKAEGSEGIMALACIFELTEVIKDLIDFGYDWAYLPKGIADSGLETEFADCIRYDKSDKRVISGQLDTWINRYVRAGKFPSADQVVFELFEKKRPDLAFRVLKAASRRIAFDLQETPASHYRISIISHLFEIREYGWAEKVFLSYPLAKNSKFLSSEEDQLTRDIGAICNPKVVEWYVKKGVPVSYSDFCLFESKYSKSLRLKMLSLMNFQGQVDWESWLSESETRWVKETAQYRQYRKFAR